MSNYFMGAGGKPYYIRILSPGIRYLLDRIVVEDALDQGKWSTLPRIFTMVNVLIISCLAWGVNIYLEAK